jgi:PII-like signaling protein
VGGHGARESPVTEALKLTTYFGERDRVEESFLADRLLDLYERHGLATSVLMRGVAGFGIKHRLRTDRLLTLSEDLPLVTVAVDRRPRIEAAATQVAELDFDGLVTLERAQILTGDEVVSGLPAATKLTLYLGRGRRASGRPLHETALAILRRAGIDGATVLIGVDGTVEGRRQRARFFARNLDVPAMVISVGPGDSIAAVVPELRETLGRPLMTVERVRVLKRDGQAIAAPEPIPAADAEGLGLWTKLMLYSSEQAHVDGHPVHVEAVRRLRRAGAAGCTALRGVWGYDGGHAPHGDTFWSLRRRVPTVTVVVDTPERSLRWFDTLDRLTGERGLVTSEIVPAFRATGPAISHGGLSLAALWKPGR